MCRLPAASSSSTDSLAAALRAELLRHSVLHADETPVAMLKPGHGKTHRAYLWSYCTTTYNQTRAVVFDFADSRAGQHARDFLGLPGEGGWSPAPAPSGSSPGFDLGIRQFFQSGHSDLPQGCPALLPGLFRFRDRCIPKRHLASAIHLFESEAQTTTTRGRLGRNAAVVLVGELVSVGELL